MIGEDWDGLEARRLSPSAVVAALRDGAAGNDRVDLLA